MADPLTNLITNLIIADQLTNLIMADLLTSKVIALTLYLAFTLYRVNPSGSVIRRLVSGLAIIR